MNKLPIALVIFSSTRGHYGHKDIYQTTINELSKGVPLCHFESLNIHVKRSLGDDDVFSSMQTWLHSKGFNVIQSHGDWKHHHPTHFIEHAKDIGTLMTHHHVQMSPYVMWLEDDVVVDGDNVERQVALAIDHLKERPLTSAVRWLDFSHDTQTLLNIHKTSHDMFVHRDVFSFRVSVLRSRDARILAQFFRHQYPDHMETHIERYATEILRFISGADYPFAAFDRAIGRHIHIGSPEFSPEWVAEVIKRAKDTVYPPLVNV